MCGRIVQAAGHEALVRAYPWLHDAPAVPPRFNIAPTDETLVVGPQSAELMPWGIGDGQRPLFNLRSETALRPGRYRRLLIESRALIPASHFYEWRQAGTRRLPMAVTRSDGGLLNIAALIDRRRRQAAATILTTTPNHDLESLHSRMPVLLSDDDAAAWVLEELGFEQVRAMLRPCPDGLLAIRPASPLVNDVRSEGPQLLDPEVMPPTFQLDLIG